jgi:hypothetical protein
MNTRIFQYSYTLFLKFFSLKTNPNASRKFIPIRYNWHMGKRFKNKSVMASHDLTNKDYPDNGNLEST